MIISAESLSRRIKSRRPSPVRLDIQFELDVYSEAEPCPYCQSPSTRTFIDFEHRFRKNGLPHVVQADVPGFRCDRCEIDSLDVDATISAYEAAKNVVRDAGDQVSLRKIKASIRALRKKE